MQLALISLSEQISYGGSKLFFLWAYLDVWRYIKIWAITHFGYICEPIVLVQHNYVYAYVITNLITTLRSFE